MSSHPSQPHPPAKCPTRRAARSTTLLRPQPGPGSGAASSRGFSSPSRSSSSSGSSPGAWPPTIASPIAWASTARARARPDPPSVSASSSFLDGRGRDPRRQLRRLSAGDAPPRGLNAPGRHGAAHHHGHKKENFDSQTRRHDDTFQRSNRGRIVARRRDRRIGIGRRLRFVQRSGQLRRL